VIGRQFLITLPDNAIMALLFGFLSVGKIQHVVSDNRVDFPINDIKRFLDIGA
jgi:hypothetical protein